MTNTVINDNNKRKLNKEMRILDHEGATKFLNKYPAFWKLLCNFKQGWKIFLNFVAFSQYIGIYPTK
jgi:hypothetical protein